MSAIDDVISERPLPRWRAAVWLAAAVFLAGLGWASVAELEEVAIATGEVVPEGKVKVIQHYEGGIIAELFVQEGVRVSAGQPLLQLEVSTPGANREDVQVRLDTLILARARLRAEAAGTPLSFPAEEAERRPDLVASERQTHRIRVQQQAEAMDTLKAQMRQRELEVRQLRDRQRTLTGDLRLARERFRMSTELVEKSLVSRLDHLAMQREVEMLEGEMSSIAIQIPRAEAALEEAGLRQKEQETRFRRDALEEINKNEPQIARNKEMLIVSEDQVRRTKIVSPIDGIVKDLRFHTLGGVVKPGDPVMQIVPVNQSLVIESRLSPTDRGYVREGQDALVKVSAYDFYRYGGLAGRVTTISADSTSTQDGVSFFRVTVETARGYLGHEADRLAITPGMQASVEIHTGSRTVLEFLLKPLLRIRYEGFRER